MWSWILALAVVVALAAVLGFTGVAVVSTALAKLLFLVLLAAFLTTIVMGISRHA